MSQSNQKPKYRFLISSIDSLGHVSTVLGFGELLASYGHQVTLTYRRYYRTFAESRNLNFIPFDDSIFGDNDPAESLGTFLEEYEANFHLQPIINYGSWDDQTKKKFASLVEDYDLTNKALEKVFREHENDFDAFIGDFVIRFPAMYRAPFPVINLMSMNPAPLYPKGPPPYSGYPVRPRDTSQSEDMLRFRYYFAKALSKFKKKLYAWWQLYNIPMPRVEEAWFFDEPQHLGFYHYPEELDYCREGLMLSTTKWHRIDALIRSQKDPTENFTVPEQLANLPGKLIYLSIGCLGLYLTDLLKKLVNFLSNVPHRFIVQKGPFGNTIELPSNMYGQDYFNQLAVLKVVDLVICHGGSNTFLEALYLGKPTVMLPLFVDQLDNAQRAVECGVGSRLDLYNLSREQLTKVIEDTLNNNAMLARIKEISTSMRVTRTRQKAVELIENFIANRRAS